jgi:hypothetical protein
MDEPLGGAGRNGWQPLGPMSKCPPARIACQARRERLNLATPPLQTHYLLIGSRHGKVLVGRATEVFTNDWYSGWLSTYSFTKGQIATTVKPSCRAYSNASRLFLNLFWSTESWPSKSISKRWLDALWPIRSVLGITVLVFGHDVWSFERSLVQTLFCAKN